MYATGNKKMLNLMILQILLDYSDSEHRLTQQDIIKLLKANYDMDCDRRSVKNNILSLNEWGYDISMEQGYYLAEREFEDVELRMLIDSVLFSRTVSEVQAKQLIDKLRKKGNKYFSAKVSHICHVQDLQHTDNKQVVYSLDIINDAISEKKKISFVYNRYGKDGKLFPRRTERYIVNPYQIVANNGRYYLIGNYDTYSNISHYRIDKMTSVQIYDETVKPIQEVEGCEHGFCLPGHMAEHIYMFSGKSVAVKFWIQNSLMDEIVDWFGKEFRVLEEKEEELLIRVVCNEKAMFFWALQYGPYVEVVEPVTLRERLAKAVAQMNEKYGGKSCGNESDS